MNPDVYYPLDEVLYLEGRARPKSNVEIQFTKQGSKPRKFVVKSDNNGEWVLAEKVPLEAGDWEVRARLALEGGESSWSNPRVFKVIVSGVTIGGINIKFAALSLTIVILLILGGFLAIYSLWRVRRLKSALVSKEIKEAHESVRGGVAELRRDLLDELKLMDSKEHSLTVEEISRKEHLLREIENVERNMERELSDIEEKI